MRSNLSWNQEPCWLISQFAPESRACHTGFSVRIQEKIDAVTLEDAFQSLVNRHACLRTLFITREEGSPVQKIYEYKKVLFEQTDASHLESTI